MSSDHHTYLRYECVDAFGLTVSTGMEVLEGVEGDTNNNRVLTMAGSHILGWNLKSCQLDIKLSTPDTSTNVGTGQALTSEHVTAIATTIDTTTTILNNNNNVIATGWNSGSIRLFDNIETKQSSSLCHSLLNTTTNNYVSSSSSSDVLLEPRVVLNGHSTSVQALRFGSTGSASLLASGCGKGTVVVWDILSESGLYRLLGHNPKGGITSLQFVLNDAYLISTSLDGLAKVWDLEGQCCIQTLVTGGDQIWSSAMIVSSSSNNNEEKDIRTRFLTGGVNGQVLVWKVEQSERKGLLGDNNTLATTTMQENEKEKRKVDNNDALDCVCHCMGPLPIDTTMVAANNERIISLRWCKQQQQQWIGVLHHNSKFVWIYQLRSERESQKKRQRRLRRRREKQHLKEQKQQLQQQENDNNSDNDKQQKKKRGFLDDDNDDDDDDENGDTKTTTNASSSSSPSASFVETMEASDEFEFYGMIRASHKIRDFLLIQEQKKNTKKKSIIKVVCALSTNALEVHTLKQNNKNTNSTSTTTITSNKEDEKPLLLDMYGHPTGIRSMAISSDHVLACTVSKHVTKIWNVARRSCLLSVTPSSASSSSSSSCYGLCVVFLPGNTHVVLGTREGTLSILNIQSGAIVFQDDKAHGGAIWGLDVSRDNNDVDNVTCNVTLATGSADKSVKFWDLVEAEDDGHPTLVQTRTLEMSDEIVAVKYSSHFSFQKKKLVFVSTLDSTIKVFFEDSLKLFLSLYGHSLPALCVSSSDDDALLASGSADKTIKVWGLDFGDTHCTLHGHKDSVTDIAFIRKTHCFITSSKDSTIRYWDADRFQSILVLEGHTAEIHCLAVTNGAFFLSGGMDRQVRVWERTRDIVFVEEERERYLEQQFDAQVVTNDEQNNGTLTILNNKRRDNDEDAIMEQQQQQPQSEAAIRKSVLSVSSGDRIMEALEQADAELIARKKKKEAGNNNSNKNMLLLNLEPSQYVSWVLRSIPSADLEQSLLLLTLQHIERLFFYLISNLKNGKEIELSCRVAIFLVTTHQKQIALHNSLLIPLRELRRLVRFRLSESRDRIGFNLAALRRIGILHQENKRIMQSSVNNNVRNNSNIWDGLGLGSDVAAALQRK
mmetsp:Transcript_43919/g.49822  ORF Transcript_43919/g.49822 Transcript_43919/m.49822 type:complete len:1114 (-) Transcript_43919:152-3493(-)